MDRHMDRHMAKGHTGAHGHTKIRHSDVRLYSIINTTIIYIYIYIYMGGVMTRGRGKEAKEIMLMLHCK